MFSPRLASSGTQAGGVCPLKGGGRGFCPGCPGGGGGRGRLVLPRILITCPGSQGTSCPCSLFMIRVEVPGSSFMLCLGPGPPSLLHLTRANAEKPYAGDTVCVRTQTCMHLLVLVLLRAHALRAPVFLGEVGTSDGIAILRSDSYRTKKNYRNMGLT